MTTLQPPVTNTILPPHSIDDERALLGAILISPDVFDEVAGIVSDDDFYVERHRWIWEAFRQLRERDMDIDVTTVSGVLGERLESAGGGAYLVRLLSWPPSSLHALSYARRVAELSARRSMLRGASEIARQAHDEKIPFDDVLASAERYIFDIAQKAIGGGDFQSAKLLVSSLMSRLESGEPPPGVSTGLPALDDIFRMRPGDFIVLAGRPGNGKTSLLMQIACHAAIQKRIPVAVFSLEMPAESIMERLVSHVTGIPFDRMQNNSLSPHEWTLFADVTGTLAESLLFVNDTPYITPVQIRSQCMRLASTHGLGLVVIDYLQLVGGSGRYKTRVEEVTEISRAMKTLARELGVPVLVAAQLSRAVEQRQDKRPMLSDLRSSGSIEQDADIVIFVYPRGEDKAAKFLSVEKHRNGPTGTAEMLFSGATFRFSGYEE